jgi:large subunit ribosomal protein L44e
MGPRFLASLPAIRGPYIATPPSLNACTKAGETCFGKTMKFPKEIRRNCPWCNKHTAHSVSLYKRGKERAGSWGARRQAGRKRGYGGQKFPELIRTAKTTKKATLRLKCKECNREMMTIGIRLRKAEIAT